MDTMGKIYLTDTLASLRDLYFNNIHRLFPQFSIFPRIRIFEFLAYHLAKSVRNRDRIPVVIDGRWQGVLFIAIHRHS